jgi:hypothetical protein
MDTAPHIMEVPASESTTAGCVAETEPLSPVDTSTDGTDINPIIVKVDPKDERVKPDGGLIRRSRRTERLRKKQIKRENRPLPEFRTIVDLPYELLMEILSLVLPTDLVRLSRTSKSLHQFIADEEENLARNIIRWRYPCLEKCYRLPVPLEEVQPCFRAALQDPGRHGFLKRPFQHVMLPDPSVICTCLTCQLRWNALCLAVDFAHFQGHLDRGDPMPMIERGKNPVWNQKLVKANAEVVLRAMQEPIWYACILQAHLESTVRAIKRHSENKGNRRRRFRMTREDERAGTDLFLERSGPPTVDFPFHRDNYYLLEAYLPNRGWNGDEGRWMYMDARQHDVDVARLAEWYERQKQQDGAQTA